jgi:hypothetical protein
MAESIRDIVLRMSRQQVDTKLKPLNLSMAPSQSIEAFVKAFASRPNQAGETIRDSRRSPAEPRSTNLGAAGVSLRQLASEQSGTTFANRPLDPAANRPPRNQDAPAFRTAMRDSFHSALSQEPLAKQQGPTFNDQQQIDQAIQEIGAQQEANRDYLRSANDTLKQIVAEIREAQNELDRIRDSLRDR